MKLYEYELVDHNQGKKVIATVWLTVSNKVQCDNPDIMKFLKTADVDGYTVNHGASFMEKFPKLFKGSYITAREVK